MGEAILNIHVKKPDNRPNISQFGPEEGHFTINIQVSRVTRSGNANAAVPYSNNSVKMSGEELRLGKWLKVNVTNMVAEFFELPRDDLAVIVRTQDSRNKTNLFILHPNSDTNNSLVRS